MTYEDVVNALKSRDLELKSETKERGEGLVVRGRSTNRSWTQNYNGIEISLGVNLGLSPRLGERNAITVKRRVILLETVIRKRERTKKIHIVTVICPLSHMKVMWLKC